MDKAWLDFLTAIGSIVTLVLCPTENYVNVTQRQNTPDSIAPH